jgi:hypothetical protein
MKESDTDYSFEQFIYKHTPKWGIRLGFPDEEVILNIGEELMTDIVIIHGINPSPPKNEKGQHAIRAKKVRVKEHE